MNLAKFFREIRYAPFPGKLTSEQVQGCEYLIKEFERRGMKDLRQLAYILATAKLETAHTMQPIKEMGSQTYLQGKRYWPWIGRGYVQLTWKANYEKFQVEVKRLFNVDIIARPDDAMIPEVAAYIAFEGMSRGSFTGKSLTMFFGHNPPDNYWYHARTIINGHDRASEIASIARAFFTALVIAQENS